MSNINSIFKLAAFMWKNSDKVIVILKMLVNKLAVIGHTLENAGQLAILSSKALKTGDSHHPGIVEMLNIAKSELENLNQNIANFNAQISTFNQNICGLSVPLVKVENEKYTINSHLPSITIPTPKPYDFKPFELFFNDLLMGTTFINDATANLQKSKEKIGEISGSLSTTSNNLEQFGKDMKEIGAILKAI